MPKNYFKTFGYAYSGFKYFFRLEANAIVHLIATVFAIGLGFYFDIKATEWLWICLAITLVFSAEMFNSAIESACDLVTTDIKPQIKAIKDISAAAVLFTAIFAIIAAVVIFKPYIA